MKKLTIRKRLLLGLAMAMAWIMPVVAAPKGTLTSPDGRLIVKVTKQDGRLYYSLQRGNTALINASALGMDITAQGEKAILLDGITSVTYKQSSQHDTWEQPWGEEAVVRNDYNEMAVAAKQKDGRMVTVRFRLFNDGMGFRYEFPVQQRLKDFVIMDELTEFNFAQDAETWSQPTNGVNYHEALYKKAPISKKDTISTPATMEVNDSLFMVVHEANLTDYASLNLAVRDGHKMVTALTPWANGDKVRVSKTRQSPWRCVIVASRAGDLITSRMILNLNEPCRIEDTSWVQPKKYVGIWWCYHMQTHTWASGPKHGATTEKTKEYIDFAAKHGFGGVLVEGWNLGWDGDWTRYGDQFSYTKPYPDYDLEGLCKYAKEKGVRIIAHNETGGAAENFERQMEEAFSLYERLGINTIKTGYVNAHFYNGELQHSQWGINHYRRVIETAARHHIMVVNHEGAMPTGLERTFPNLIGTENMRGQEYNGWSRDGGNPPYHECILPFTRGLGGPMDYTPGIVNMRNRVNPDSHPRTTMAKQLAEYIVLFSPGHMAADNIENYEGSPALSFIETVGTNWETTLVPHAKIGEYVTIVRKEKGTDRWFVGSMTDETARTLDLKFDFLGEGKYRAYIYEDTPDSNGMTNPYPMATKEIDITASSIYQLRLAPSGGCVMRIVKVNEEPAGERLF